MRTQLVSLPHPCPPPPAAPVLPLLRPALWPSSRLRADLPDFVKAPPHHERGNALAVCGEVAREAFAVPARVVEKKSLSDTERATKARVSAVLTLFPGPPRPLLRRNPDRREGIAQRAVARREVGSRPVRLWGRLDVVRAHDARRRSIVPRALDCAAQVPLDGRDGLVSRGAARGARAPRGCPLPAIVRAPPASRRLFSRPIFHIYRVSNAMARFVLTVVLAIAVLSTGAPDARRPG